MSFDVHIERLIDTTPELAFRTWIDPEAMQRWYCPDDGVVAEATADVRVGGQWRVAFGASTEELYREHGVFHEVEPPRRLVYTSTFTFPDGRSFETLMTVSFDECDGKTLLTVHDARYPSAEERDAHARGWPSFIDRYERTVATA